jgi:hypothetical protein
MLIYFDESYDNNHKYLLLGALFNPHPKFLHRELNELRAKYNYYGEIKYNNCINNFRLEVYKKAIDIFFKSTSYFRCVVIDQEILDLDYFGKRNEDNSIKMARAYKKFAEHLISHNTDDVYNGVLLTDELKRCKGDKFIELMKQDFCMVEGKHCNDKNKPTLKHISDIKSDLENYQVGQINDLLLGCVLNNLIPTSKEYKNHLREYLTQKLSVDNLLPEYWNKYSKKYVEEYYPKFNIWYWKPSNQKTPENSEAL